MGANSVALEITEEGQQRALTRWNALAIVVGAVIGTGLHLRPASVAQLVQAPAAIVGVWVGAGLRREASPGRWWLAMKRTAKLILAQGALSPIALGRARRVARMADIMSVTARTC